MLEPTDPVVKYWRDREARWQHGTHDKRGLDYYTQAPMDQLEEWNEENIFEYRNACVSHGSLGVMVTMEFRSGEPVFDAGTPPVAFIMWEEQWQQLCAVYGDDDDLKRLTIFTNARTRSNSLPLTTEYIDAPIRQ